MKNTNNPLAVDSEIVERHPLAMAQTANPTCMIVCSRSQVGILQFQMTVRPTRYRPVLLIICPCESFRLLGCERNFVDHAPLSSWPMSVLPIPETETRLNELENSPMRPGNTAEGNTVGSRISLRFIQSMRINILRYRENNG